MKSFEFLGGKAVRIAGLILAFGALSACATVGRNALPIEQQSQARIADMPDNIRAFGIRRDAAFQHDFAKAIVDGGPEAGCDDIDGNPVFCVLILSGGGGYGAFGAGVLNGWSQSDSRPEFKIVTGVSTGALIAPFAFLGTDWDDELATAFRTIETDADVFRTRGVVGILTKDSFTDTAALQSMIANFVTQDFLDAVAREHRKGRRLYVGTTNLDRQELTVWNLGAIANSAKPSALGLFRQILLASASIPVVMPPVMFDVEVDGVPYDEMHVDGGVQAQFFVPLVVIDLPAAIAEAQAAGFDYTPTPRMFVIRNGKFLPEAENTDRNIAEIAIRTLESMTQSMGRGDLYQIYAITKARGTDFFYNEIPESFIWGSDHEFDGSEMRRLYDIGLAEGLNEDSWKRVPPGLFATNIEEVISDSQDSEPAGSEE
ncbi:patatin-like phospholipase family protein [Altererythrobacter sp.]|nr:patatin-like phospholipase family protein [Altererythrobacter sp.]